jgi:thiol-disulfide isomerase/thioredoxin
VLPLAELALATALVPAATAPYAALGAGALLLAFAALIARAVRAGVAPDCHCFGQLHAAPAGRATLLRNGLLAALAGAVAAAALLDADGAPSLTGWLDTVSDAALVGLAAAIVLAVVLTAFAWFGVELLRQNGRLLERLDHLEDLLGRGDAGLPAPDLPLTDLAGDQVVLEELLDARLPLLLVFSDPGCGPCRALMPEVAGWQRELTDRLAVAVVSGRGPAAEAYGVAGTPSALLIAPGGTIVAGPAGGAEAIRALVADATAPGAAAPRLAVRQVPGGTRTTGADPDADAPRTLAPGDALPAFDLPGLDGPVRASDLAGAPALLVFWDPGCGFCDRMRDDLLALDRRLADAGAQLVVLSSGDEQATRALGLHAIVAFDPGFTVGFASGAAGTPSALLVDSHGRLAAAPVTGAAAVLTLGQELLAPSRAA